MSDSDNEFREILEQTYSRGFDEGHALAWPRFRVELTSEEVTEEIARALWEQRKRLCEIHGKVAWDGIGEQAQAYFRACAQAAQAAASSKIPRLLELAQRRQSPWWIAEIRQCLAGLLLTTGVAAALWVAWCIGTWLLDAFCGG